MKHRKIYALLALLLALLLLAGCGATVTESAGRAPNEPLTLLPEGTDSPAATAKPQATPKPTATPESAATAAPTDAPLPEEEGSYTTKEDVTAYLIAYGHLPPNFITKSEARAAGWPGGSLEPYCPGKCIGGDRFGNREGLLPTAKGRSYTECDINTLGKRSRGAERLIFSNDGLIFYTADHYESFEQVYP